MNGLEIVADLQNVRGGQPLDLVRRWAAEDPTGLLIRRATFAISDLPPDGATGLPSGWSLVSTPPPGFWDALLDAAGQDGHPALVLLGAVEPSVDAVGLLLGVLDEDPMFGAAVARVQCERGCCLQTLDLPGWENGSHREWLPRRALHHLPPLELPGDIVGPCLEIRPLVLTDFSTADQPFESLLATVVHRLTAARRCGFRSALANRALVRLADASCNEPPDGLPELARGDAERLRLLLDEAVRGVAECRGGSLALAERLLVRQFAVHERRVRPNLLLDLRNVRRTYNGTAFAALGAAWGLYQVAQDRDVAILAHPAGAAFHDFESTFPAWTIHTKLPPGQFSAALRLSQPWHIQEMVDLHRVARFNAYLMLDTIAWDTLYCAPPHLDGTWDFLASAADGLLFISDFSRRRFQNRFPEVRAPLQDVCHLSFDPRDYTRPECLNAPSGQDILVIGNQLDHKDVDPTVHLLAAAFPYVSVQALGSIRSRSPHVTVHQSGKLAEAEVHRLYSQAKLVVFPSFYEGFGLPVVTALAYGRTLFMRASPLVDEIAPYCPVSGHLITYSRRSELVDRVGRMLHGETVCEVPAGAAVNGCPRSWRDVGNDLLGFIETLTARGAPGDWQRRERTVRQLIAYRS